MAMNRRQVLGAALCAGVAPQLSGQPAAGEEIWVNPASGDDRASGSRSAPLRTLAEAARRVNRSEGAGPVTIYLSEGIYSIGETTLLRPERRRFSREARLTIRAAVLPDDPEWDTGKMPTLIHTMPVPPEWNGRPDPLGGAANGMLVDTSHVTIRGLKFLGLPAVETPRPGLIRRLYGISRLRRDLEDLEIAQCLFAGDTVTAPLHVAVIALGNGVNVHHCIFRGCKIATVFWMGGSRGHAFRNCVCDHVYGSAVWTSGIQDDFDYRNNVVTGCLYVWTNQSGATASADAAGRSGRQGAPAGQSSGEAVRYRVIDCYFAGNSKLAGTGTGARLEYSDIDPSFMLMTGTKIASQPVAIEMDSTRRNYLHPVAGSEAAGIGAGLFIRS